jgi:hypothetical protein
MSNTIEVLRAAFPELRAKADDYVEGVVDGLLWRGSMSPLSTLKPEPGLERTWAACEWRAAHVTAAGLTGALPTWRGLA